MKEKTVKTILESTPELYDQIAHDFYQTRKKPWPTIDLIKSHLSRANNIIDLGCGSGRLSELVSEEQNYLGIDNSQELIKIAQNNYSNRKNINFQVQDLINDKLAENKFDLALLIAVFHHLPTVELRLSLLSNIKSSLKKDGILIITSWNLWQKDYRRYLFNYKLKILKYKIFNLNDAFIPWQKNQQRYVHSFNQRELKKLLKTAGFEVKEIFYEYRGQKTSLFKGKNLVAVARKI